MINACIFDLEGLNESPGDKSLFTFWFYLVWFLCYSYLVWIFKICLFKKKDSQRSYSLKNLWKLFYRYIETMNMKNEHLEFFDLAVFPSGILKFFTWNKKKAQVLGSDDSLEGSNLKMNLCLQPWEKLMQMVTSM